MYANANARRRLGRGPGLWPAGRGARGGVRRRRQVLRGAGQDRRRRRQELLLQAAGAQGGQQGQVSWHTQPSTIRISRYVHPSAHNQAIDNQTPHTAEHYVQPSTTRYQDLVLSPVEFQT